MSDNMISNILAIVLSIMIFILIILVVILVTLKLREKAQNKTKNDMAVKKTKKDNIKTDSISSEYSRQSILDFMDFDKIENNMIIQRNGKRFLMVIECQGVNYDLMSKVEKVGVEEGFQQFLNTLKHPIQIYIQTRTINLERSILTYKSKVNEIEKRYKDMLYKYNRMVESQQYSKEQLDKYYFELTKQKNLLEYGKDLVNSTEKMSLNRNILNKKFYIIIPYFSEESNGEKYDSEEIKNIAFSELYTKAQSVIRTISSCSVLGKILNSEELAELLYVAYNRDESEIFGLNKALKAGYDELYSTAPDVFEKRIKILDEEITNRAIDTANEAIDKVKSAFQQQAEEKERNMDELIDKMAQLIIEENKDYVGEDIADEAIKEIEKSKEKGVKKNVGKKKETKSRKS